jgi:hypothetical protein
MNAITCFPVLACGARTAAETPDSMISSLASTHPGLPGFLTVGLFIFGLSITVASFVGRGTFSKWVSRQNFSTSADRWSEA